VKARKEHKCSECRRTIRKGEFYRRIRFCSDGHWEGGKRCPQCYQIGVDYCCGILTSGAVWEWMWESVGVNLRTGETRE